MEKTTAETENWYRVQGLTPAAVKIEAFTEARVRWKGVAVPRNGPTHGAFYPTWADAVEAIRKTALELIRAAHKTTQTALNGLSRLDAGPPKYVPPYTGPLILDEFPDKKTGGTRAV